MIVCSGNINRSPAAATMLRFMFKSDTLQVSSSGLGKGSMQSKKMGSAMNSVMERAGYPWTEHYSEHISSYDLKAFDYILVMGPGQKKKIQDMSIPESKVKNLGAYIGLSSIPDPQFTGQFSEVVSYLERSLKAFLEEVGLKS